jgi:hypothetical protein
MPYSQFTTISKVKSAFGLEIREGARFLPQVAPVTPSDTLLSFLEQSLPVASFASEKARSEGIIYPVLLELRRLQHQQISLFSGEDFSIDEAAGLNGVCDFLIGCSPEVLEIEAPVVVIVEAKKAELKTGLGQCIAEMVAAQRFNEGQGHEFTIYGAVSSGIQWQFLKLEGCTVTIDLTIYPLPPVEVVLADLLWMTNCSVV